MTTEKIRQLNDDVNRSSLSLPICFSAQNNPFFNQNKKPFFSIYPVYYKSKNASSFH